MLSTNYKSKKQGKEKLTSSIWKPFLNVPYSSNKECLTIILVRLASINRKAQTENALPSNHRSF